MVRAAARAWRRLGAAAAGAALLAGGCGGGAERPNEPPGAVLGADDLDLEVQTGGAITFSAVGSDDPDGIIVAYRFVFSDGTPAAQGPATTERHHFPRPGRYQVDLVVVDDDGAEGRATLEVNVVDACEGVSCASEGKDCGEIPDQCGFLLHCGTCDPPERCGARGTPNVCGG